MVNKKKPNQIHYLATKEYLGTRAAALHFPSKEFDKYIADDSVYGVIIDYPVNPLMVQTMVVFINGAVNVYANNGGKYTGASSRYTGLASAGRILVMNASRILGEAKPTTSFPLPTDRRYNMYLLTRKGIYLKQYDMATMAQESKDMQAVQFLYHKVEQELRSAQLKDQAKKG